MNRYVLFVCAVVCVLSLVHGAGATTLDVNLDLNFADPCDAASGGNWTVSALAGNFGLAGIAFDVVPSNFTGNFLISNTIFEILFPTPIGSGTGFFFQLGDDLVTPTLNVGVGSYVGLVTGTFDPNSVPALLNVEANLFNASAKPVAVTPPNLTTSLTTNCDPNTPPIVVDIKPGSFPNSVNLKSKGVLPVAILGTDVFDVNDVDIATLLFGDPNSGAAVSPLRSALEDVSGDGFLDLTLKFSTRDLVENGALGPDTIEGRLTGELFDGTPFLGIDSIRIVSPNGSQGNSLHISAVPEPTTCTLALAALCLAMSRRRAF